MRGVVVVLAVGLVLAPACGDSGGTETGSDTAAETGDDTPDDETGDDTDDETGDDTDDETGDDADDETGDPADASDDPADGTDDEPEDASTGDEDDAGPEPDAGGDDEPLYTAEDAPLRGACALEERYGGFLLESQPMFSFIDGAITDGVNPTTILEETLTAGDCKLLKRNNPFCDPPCQAGDTCDHSGQCIPFPLNQDLGTVTFDGLAEAVSLEPIEPSYNYFSTTLPHPAVQPGDLVTMKTAADGTYGALALYGIGVHDMSVTDEDQWDIAEGESLTLTWDPPPGGGDAWRSRVYVVINIDQHGNSPVNLECDFDDDGEATVPHETIDALLTAGISGFPSGVIARRTVDSVPVGDGCAELIVASPRNPDVRVAGHTPCKSDLDCPSGQTCTIAIETCE